MGRYSLKGSPDFDAKIDRDLSYIVERIQQLPSAPGDLGIVLLGGYGRGEGTPLTDSRSGKEMPFNDYDFIVVTDTRSPLKIREQRMELRQLSVELKAALGIAVDIFLHTRESLKRCPATLLNIEMQHGHHVLFGPKDLLGIMPPYRLTDVPLTEGTRLLMNRGSLLLYVQDILNSYPQGSLPDLDRRRCQNYLYKNALGFGDCSLLLMGKYDLFYRNKLKSIHQLHKLIPRRFSEKISAAYDTAIQFKLYGDEQMLLQTDIRQEFEMIKSIFQEFLLWYESQRLQQSILSITEYCAILPKAERLTCPLYKTLAMNGLFFHWHMFSPEISWSLVHPRYRLLPSLCLLLENCEKHNDLLSQLLGCSQELSEIKRRFNDLISRLS